MQGLRQNNTTFGHITGLGRALYGACSFRTGLILAGLVLLSGGPSPVLAAAPLRLEASVLSRPLSLDDRSARISSHALILGLARAGARIIAVGQNGTVLLSDDDGLSFRTARKVPVKTTLTNAAFLDSERGFAVGHDGVILQTQDGGETWIRRHYDTRAGGPLMDVLPFADGRVMAIGAYGQYLLSTTQGKTWQSRPFALGVNYGIHLNNITVASLDHSVSTKADATAGPLYLSTELAVLFRSDDDGKSFHALRIPAAGPFFSSLAMKNRVLMVFSATGAILRSEDEGRSWRVNKEASSEALFAATALDDTRLVVVGAKGLVLASDDLGVEFSSYQLSSGASLSDVLALGDNTLLLAGEDGLWRLPTRFLEKAVSPVSNAR